MGGRCKREVIREAWGSVHRTTRRAPVEWEADSEADRDEVDRGGLIVRVLTICVILVVGLVSAGLAGPLCEALVRHPGLAEELEVTDGQIQRLEELFESTEREIIEAEARIRSTRLGVEREVRSESPDMRRIRKLVNEAQQARSEVELARIQRDVTMREILTGEQLEQARSRMGRMGAGCGGHHHAREKGHTCQHREPRGDGPRGDGPGRGSHKGSGRFGDGPARP